MANFPDYLEMTWSRLKEIMKPGKVGALTKEIIALAVSVTNGCRYRIHSHMAAVQRLGYGTPAQTRKKACKPVEKGA